MRWSGTAVLYLIVPGTAMGQGCSLADVDACPGIREEQVRPALEEALDRTVAVRSGLSTLLGDLGESTILGDLSLRFKTFEAQEADRPGLGLAYAFEKSLARSELAARPNLRRFDFRVTASGNIAFDASANPRDFLETKANLGWLHASGGVASDTASDAMARELAGMVEELAGLETFAELEASPLHRRVLDLVTSHLETQVVVSVNGNAALESDQRFETRQMVYGGTLGIELHAWNPSSTLAQLNVFDWPFAALRFLTGDESELRPRGSAIPSIRASLHQVDPHANPQLEALGETNSFTRFSLEAGYRTAAGQLGSRRLLFEANARHFRHVSPSDVIKSAGLHSATYLVMALTTTDGFVVTYSVGELPFDARSDQVYELGFRFRF